MGQSGTLSKVINITPLLANNKVRLPKKSSVEECIFEFIAHCLLNDLTPLELRFIVSAPARERI